MMKLKMLFFHILLLVGFNLSYYFIISREFSYFGFTAIFDFNKLLVVSIITLLLIILYLNIKDDFISLIWLCFFYLFYVGQSIYYQFAPNSHWETIFGLIVFLVGLPYFSYSKKRLKTFKFKGDSVSTLFLLAIIMFLPIFLTSFRDINYKNLFLIDIYDTRAAFREMNVPLIGYLRAPLARIILPYLIVRFIEKKNYFKVFLCISMILFIFLAGALKSVFIGLFATLIFYPFSYSIKKRALTSLFFFLNWGGIFVYMINKNLFLLDGFVRRVFFTPAYLNNIYTEYFKDNFTNLSHSPFGLGLVKNQYGSNLSMFVGEHVLGLPGLNANVGLFTEGYISFGLSGVIVMCIIIWLIFKYFSALRIDARFFGIIFVYIYYMNTSFLSILLLTHGLGFLMIFSYFYLNRKRNEL